MEDPEAKNDWAPGELAALIDRETNLPELLALRSMMDTHGTVRAKKSSAIVVTVPMRKPAPPSQPKVLPDDISKRSIDIGVDCHDFKPLDMWQIAAIMDRKKWQSPFIDKRDEHGTIESKPTEG